MRVLVVEDETRLAALLQRGLREDGYVVDVAGTGPTGLWRATEFDYDAVIMDWMLPGMSGPEVCAELRRRGRWAPVIMLTARTAVEDRIAGLDSGADDYLSKPFAYSELTARLRALLRRGSLERAPTISAGELTIDPAARVAAIGGQELSLSAKEYDVLELLLRNKETVLSRGRDPRARLGFRLRAEQQRRRPVRGVPAPQGLSADGDGRHCLGSRRRLPADRGGRRASRPIRPVGPGPMTRSRGRAAAVATALRGIRVRLAITYSVAAAVLVAAGALSIAFLLHRGLVQNVDTALIARDAQLTLAGAVVLPPSADAPSGGAADRFTTVTQLYSANGAVQASQPGSVPALLSPAQVAEADNDPRLATVSMGGDRIRVLWHTLGGEQDGEIVVVAASLRQVDDDATDINQALMLAAPILVLLAGGGTWLLSGAALRPVERMRADAAALRTSDRATR